MVIYDVHTRRRRRGRGSIGGLGHTGGRDRGRKMLRFFVVLRHLLLLCRLWSRSCLGSALHSALPAVRTTSLGGQWHHVGQIQAPRRAKGGLRPLSAFSSFERGERAASERGPNTSFVPWWSSTSAIVPYCSAMSYFTINTITLTHSSSYGPLPLGSFGAVFVP